MGGVISIEQATCVARASKRFGNGVIELTNRANIQLRGIAPEHEAELIATLVQAGLGATSDQADEASNLLLSPLAGICPHALLDVRSLAQSLLQRLQQGSIAAIGTRISGKDTEGTQAGIASLSPKFSVQLDGGESLAMLGHHHDIWFSALPRAVTPSSPPTSLLQQGNWFAFGIAGSPPTIAQPSKVLGAVNSSLVPDLASALVKTFLTLRTDQDRRIRDIVNRLGSTAVWQHAARLLAALPTGDACDESEMGGEDDSLEALNGRLMPPDAALLAWRRAPVDIAARFGAHEQGAKVSVSASASALSSTSSLASSPLSFLQYIGGQAPLGRLRAEELSQLASLAQTFQQGERSLRVTPWQGILLPNIAPANAQWVQSGLREAGLIDSPLQPLGALVACTGNSGCAKGHADSKADAYALAERLDRPLAVHLSACERSCAAAHPMLFTLLAQPSGAYDLYHTRIGQISSGDAKRDASNANNGNNASEHTETQTEHQVYASADASANPRFGRRIAAGLTIDQAATYLNTLSDAEIDLTTEASIHPSIPLSTHSSPALSMFSSTDTSPKSHA